MKCWGCNEDKVSIFSSLAGSNLCKDCKQNIFSPEVTKNSIQNAAVMAEKRIAHDEKATKQAKKIVEHGKNFLNIVFGVIALLWFIVMLPAQPDFAAIVIGWLIIGVIYLGFKISSR